MTLTFSRLWRLVTAFEADRLPERDWNHRSRLVFGLWYVLNPSQGGPLAAMRRGIIECVTKLEGLPAVHRGYDEAITVFYLDKIREFAISAPPDLGLLELANALLTSELAYPLRHLTGTGCGGGGRRLANGVEHSEPGLGVPLFLWEPAAREAAVAA